MMLALGVGSFVGLVLYVASEILWWMGEIAVANSFFDRDENLGSPLGILAPYLLFGTPVAIVLGVIIGLPIWKIADAKGRRGRGDAARIGACVGLLIGILMLGLSLWSGWQTYRNDNVSFDSWRWGYQIISDGMPTSVGWLYWLKDLLLMAPIGAVAGLGAWRASGLRSKKGQGTIEGE